MSSMGRKIARQNKKQTPEEKEQTKQEQSAKLAAKPNSTLTPGGNNATGFQPRMFQRRSGNA